MELLSRVQSWPCLTIPRPQLAGHSQEMGGCGTEHITHSWILAWQVELLHPDLPLPWKNPEQKEERLEG